LAEATVQSNQAHAGANREGSQIGVGREFRSRYGEVEKGGDSRLNGERLVNEFSSLVFEQQFNLTPGRGQRHRISSHHSGVRQQTGDAQLNHTAETYLSHAQSSNQRAAHS